MRKSRKNCRRSLRVWLGLDHVSEVSSHLDGGVCFACLVEGRRYKAIEDTWEQGYFRQVTTDALHNFC